MDFPRITLTGVDDLTSIKGLQALCTAYPTVEIGILLSLTPNSRQRYPTYPTVLEFMGVLQDRCAVHICGSRARQLLFTRPDWVKLPGRIQVNGPIDPARLKGLVKILPCPVITQHCKSWNGDLLDHDVENHHVLMDSSGGRGIAPKSWWRPATQKPLGFAGGLGPDNLRQALPGIRSVACGDWWVDMESKLRDEDDWFDLGRALEVAQTFSEVCPAS